MTKEKLRVEVIGDLDETEARAFVYGDDKIGWDGIIKDNPDAAAKMPEDEVKWEEIKEICGSNMGLLISVVEEARSWGNWEDAFEAVLKGPLSEVMGGFSPHLMPKRSSVLPDWNKGQWEKVLQRLLTAPSHAVLFRELAAELGDGDVGETALMSMVEFNLLTLRPASKLAHDLPQEVFVVKKEVALEEQTEKVVKQKGEVVTLPSPAHVYAAKLHIAKLRKKKFSNKKNKKKVEGNLTP